MCVRCVSRLPGRPPSSSQFWVGVQTLPLSLPLSLSSVSLKCLSLSVLSELQCRTCGPLTLQSRTGESDREGRKEKERKGRRQGENETLDREDGVERKGGERPSWTGWQNERC